MNDSSSEAIKLYKKQEYRKAANLLKNALQIEPDNFDNNELLGYCYINNYQFDKALEIFKKLFIKRPENMSVHNGIGLSYHGQGKYEQALKVYDMLLAIEPENAFCYFNRSEAFIDMGLFDEAIDSLNAFLILVPGDIIALNNRAYCYLQNNEYARAVDEFSGIIKADNSYPNAFLHRAKAYYNMGNKKQCIYDLRKAYTLGLYKAERFLNEWELPPVQYSLYKAMAFLREKDKESLGKPLKIKNYERFITEFTDIGINVMDDLFWMDYFIHDGLSYDGVELFSIAHDALIEKEFYTLPDIVAQNINFRDRHPDSSKYILLGKTDEDLILYDAEGEEFLLAAREDLLIYQSFSDISVLLSLLWGINIGNYAENKMRNALNNEISEFFKENNFKNELFERFINVIKEQIVNQINIVEKIPITVSDVFLGHDLCGIIILSEPAHVYVQNLKISFQKELNNKIISWHIDEDRAYKFFVDEYFSINEINELEKLFYKPLLTFYSLKAGSYFLKLGDELPWKDYYEKRSEKYNRALVFWEKAALLNSDIQYFIEKLKEILELF